MTNRCNIFGMAGSVLLAGNGRRMPMPAFATNTSIGPAGLPEGSREEWMLAIEDCLEMKSHFRDHKGWDTEVSKMITVCHAPLNKSGVAAMNDCLVQQYGVAPAPTEGSGTR